MMMTTRRTYETACTTVASLQRGGGRTTWMTPFRGVDTQPKINLLWLKLDRTLDKRRGKMGGVRRGQLKNVITFRGAAQGDTNPSDATDADTALLPAM